MGPVCTACNSTFIVQNNQCTCDAGYELVGSQCTVCRAGTFKPAVGTDTKCTPCPENAECVGTGLSKPACVTGFVLDSTGATCVVDSANTQSAGKSMIDSSLMMLVIVAVLVCTLFLSAGGFLLYRSNRRASRRFKNESAAYALGVNMSSNTVDMGYLNNGNSMGGSKGGLAGSGNDRAKASGLPAECVISTESVAVGDVVDQRDNYLLFAAQLNGGSPVSQQVLDRTYGQLKFVLKVVNDDYPDTVAMQVQALNREANILFMFGHPNVCQIVGYCENPFAMILHHYHATLDKCMMDAENTGILADELGQTIAGRDMAAGVAAIHQLNVAHTDINPANVAVVFGQFEGGESFRCSLINFGNGIVLKNATGSTRLSQFGYTPNYAAPETFGIKTVRDVDPLQADVYALGMTLLAIISKSIPYEGLDMESIVTLINTQARLDWFCEPETAMARLALRAASFEPASRPSSQDLWVKLRNTVNLVMNGGGGVVTAPSTMNTAVMLKSTIIPSNMNTAVSVKQQSLPEQQSLLVRQEPQIMVSATDQQLTNGGNDNAASAAVQQSFAELDALNDALNGL